MSQTIYLTTNEYQNEASAQAQSCGGLVLTLGSTVIPNGGESVDVWTYRATAWGYTEEDTTAYFYSDMENDLLGTGAVIYSNALPTESQNEQGATSVIVKGIEKELGVDLDVNSDSELHSILRKNGAEPLSELLKMAYGTEKKKTETKR